MREYKRFLICKDCNILYDDDHKEGETIICYKCNAQNLPVIYQALSKTPKEQND